MPRKATKLKRVRFTVECKVLSKRVRSEDMARLKDVIRGFFADSQDGVKIIKYAKLINLETGEGLDIE